MKNLLTLENVNKVYEHEKLPIQVLTDINMEISAEEMVSIQGPSGCGKTTLLSIIGTLLRPTSGKVFILKQYTTRLDENKLCHFRNKNIGFIFQFHHLLPDFTSLENVFFPAAVELGTVTNEIKNYAQYLLQKVGLSNHEKYKVNELSGGQKQRVAIARALMNRPALVLADEPTGNLDRNSAFQVMNLIKEIQKDNKTTFIISTHDDEIANYCNIKIKMLDGKIINY